MILILPRRPASQPAALWIARD